MSDGDNQGSERDVRQRILSRLQSIGKAPQKPIAGEELQKLKRAANRLDEMLKASADAEEQKLRDAAGRLDQLLSDIRAGNDFTGRLRRRSKAQRSDG